MKSKNREFGMNKKQGVLLHRSMMGLLLSVSSLALGACGTMGSAWDDATSVFSSSAPYAGDIKPTVSGAPAEGQPADKTAKAEPAPPPAVPATPVAEEQVAAAPAPQPEVAAAAPEPVPAMPAQPEPAAEPQVAAAEPAPAPAPAADAAPAVPAPAVPAYVPDNLRYLNGSGSATSAAEAAASQPYPNLAEVPPRPAPGPTAAQQQQEIAQMQSGAATTASQPVGAVMPAEPAAPAAPQATPMPVMPEIPALAGAMPVAATSATPVAASPVEPMPAGAAPAPVAESAPASVADVYQRALNQRYQPGMAPVPPRVDPLLPPSATATPAPMAAMPAPATATVMGPAALQVYFGNGGSKLAAGDLSRLSQLAEKQKIAVARVKVTGYSSADGAGDAVTRAVRSLQLATDRANAVAKQLVVFGVDPTMIEVEAATLPAGTASKDGRRADIALSQ
ncbi:OmpA family protein [Radicibacter daui]|uniref:OmpA family protein n=1 Tax=Radicibacter daui TaxID=3064829 RepID=UPI00404695CF